MAGRSSVFGGTSAKRLEFDPPSKTFHFTWHELGACLKAWLRYDDKFVPVKEKLCIIPGWKRVQLLISRKKNKKTSKRELAQKIPGKFRTIGSQLFACRYCVLITNFVVNSRFCLTLSESAGNDALDHEAGADRLADFRRQPVWLWRKGFSEKFAEKNIQGQSLGVS